MTMVNYGPQFAETSGRKVWSVAPLTMRPLGRATQGGAAMASVESAVDADVSPAHPSVCRIDPRDMSDVLAKGHDDFDDFMEYISQNLSLLSRSLLIGTQDSGAHDPEFRGRCCRENLDRSPPTQMIRKVVGGDAVEAAHPFLDM